MMLSANNDMPLSREDWLLKASVSLIKMFKEAGYDVPLNTRLSCGFPVNTRGGNSIGQCWGTIHSADGSFVIFISPELSDPGKVVEVLIHELTHTVVGLDAGHGKAFKQCAVALGLTGKMTATKATDELKATIRELLCKLPIYPHATLTRPKARQSTRLIKVTCSLCSYTVRIARKWLDYPGAPECPEHHEIMKEGV